MYDHAFGPIYNENSKLLILGSFPSVRSRKDNFYYAHPSNRFWPLMARLFNREPARTIEEKKALILEEGLALYDAVERAEIEGSMDKDLKMVQPADIETIIKATRVKKICCNGTASYKIVKGQGYDPIKLPSTSAANARYRMDDLYQAWKVILDYI